MSGLSKQAHALLLRALLPYPSKKPRPKQSFFGLLMHLWKNKLQKFLKSVWAISLYLCLAFICSYATPTVGRSLWGDAEVAGGRLLLNEFVLQSCQYRSWTTARACWRQILYSCGWQSWSSCMWSPLHQVMIALKLHQVNFAHLAFHTVVREIMVSCRAIAVSKPNQCRNSEGSSRGSFKGQRAPCLTVTGCVLFLVTFF